MSKETVNIKSASVFGTDCVILQLSASDKEKVKALIDEGKPLAAVIGTVSQKRSMSANAYAWALMNKLAEKINRPVLDIYRDLIRDVPGSSHLISVREDAYSTLVADWTSHGDGWQCSKLDEMITPQGTFYTVQCWRGSSVYDSTQMHRLIELIVQECQQQGIPTLTPDEIAKLKGLEDESK